MKRVDIYFNIFTYTYLTSYMIKMNFEIFAHFQVNETIVCNSSLCSFCITVLPKKKKKLYFHWNGIES